MVKWVEHTTNNSTNLKKEGRRRKKKKKKLLYITYSITECPTSPSIRRQNVPKIGKFIP